MEQGRQRDARGDAISASARVPGSGHYKSIPPDRLFVDLEQAAAASGFTVTRLKTLIRLKKLKARGGSKDSVVSLASLASLQKPSATDSAPKSQTRSRPKRLDKFDPPGSDSIVLGDALSIIRRMRAGSVQAVVTSPPYWGQRVYADERPVRWSDRTSTPLGRELSPESYVRHSGEVLGALLRVLRPGGTVWWNIGDSYMTRTIMRASSSDRVQHFGGLRTAWAKSPHRRYSSGHQTLKDKDLALIPYRLCDEAQRRGYYVRALIIWSKQAEARANSDGAQQTTVRAHVPEVVADRPVTGHEYVLMLSKSKRYDYYPQEFESADRNGHANTRTVWHFKPVSGAGHAARFPEELPRRCISLGSRRGQLIFDPFAGEGTTLLVAKALGRHYLGCDVSPTYVRLARSKLRVNRKTR